MKSLIPWRRGPDTQVASFRDAMNQLFDDFWTGPQLGFMAPWAEGEQQLGWFPQTDVEEDAEAIKLTAELPGMDESDIKVSLENRQLVIAGDKKSEEKVEGKNYHRMERSFGTFRRVLNLPCEVEEDKIHASFKKGVLSVNLPKTAKARKEVKTIPIKTA